MMLHELLELAEYARNNPALIDNHIINNVHIGLINAHMSNRNLMDDIRHVDGMDDAYCLLLAENEKISKALKVYGVNTKRRDYEPFN